MNLRQNHGLIYALVVPPEKMGVNQKGVNKICYSSQKYGLTLQNVASQNTLNQKSEGVDKILV